MMLIEIGHCRDVHDFILCHECGYINHLSDGLLNVLFLMDYLGRKNNRPSMNAAHWSKFPKGGFAMVAAAVPSLVPASSGRANCAWYAEPHVHLMIAAGRLSWTIACLKRSGLPARLCVYRYARDNRTRFSCDKPWAAVLNSFVPASSRRSMLQNFPFCRRKSAVQGLGAFSFFAFNIENRSLTTAWKPRGRQCDGA